MIFKTCGYTGFFPLSAVNYFLRIIALYKNNPLFIITVQNNGRGKGENPCFANEELLSTRPSMSRLALYAAHAQGRAYFYLPRFYLSGSFNFWDMTGNGKTDPHRTHGHSFNFMGTVVLYSMDALPSCAVDSSVWDKNKQTHKHPKMTPCCSQTTGSEYYHNKLWSLIHMNRMLHQELEIRRKVQAGSIIQYPVFSSIFTVAEWSNWWSWLLNRMMMMKPQQAMAQPVGLRHRYLHYTDEKECHSYKTERIE